ncbi:hypothetical protein ANANG_G00133120 [Anguilla anguilla]|uniref:Uncharacterized protein n=1 Tax=Anguilla anguilla TaxID=7936 RepID=A0A9D3RVT3_ANGAN|nr:hypothetical protein ANANG_G00133120 [Anguilla anguilla]
MGTIPKPKRTVTIQMGPHIAVVDSFGNKEPTASWEKEPNLKLNSTSTPPKEHRQDNVCMDMSMANRIHHSRQPSRADMSASASVGHGGSGDSEGLIGRGLGAGDLRESPRKGCQASAGEESPIPPKDDLRACGGVSKALGFEERPVDPTAGRLRSHTPEGFQKREVTSASTQAARETSGPERASEARVAKRDHAGSAGIPGIPADEDVPVKSDGSVHTALPAQTAKPEVHQENSEHQGSERGETSPLSLREGLSGGQVTRATLHSTELTDTEGNPQEELGAQNGSGSSSHPHSSGLLLGTLLEGRGADPTVHRRQRELHRAQRGGPSGATWRDAEVQAVPEVCSRSAGTSPSRFPLATPPDSAVRRQEGALVPRGPAQCMLGHNPRLTRPRDDASPKEGGVFSDACVQTAVSVSSRARAGPSPPPAARSRRAAGRGAFWVKALEPAAILALQGIRTWSWEQGPKSQGCIWAMSRKGLYSRFIRSALRRVASQTTLPAASVSRSHR